MVFPSLQYVKIIRYDHSLSVRSLNCSHFIEACVTFCSLSLLLVSDYRRLPLSTVCQASDKLISTQYDIQPRYTKLHHRAGNIYINLGTKKNRFGSKAENSRLHRFLVFFCFFFFFQNYLFFVMASLSEMADTVST